MRRIAPLLFCLLVACTRSNMDSQPKYQEYEPAGLFSDRRVLQAPVPGTIARGDLVRAKEITQKPQITAQLLARGREQYDVFCSPCHDRAGTGNGVIVQRGFPRPASLDEERLRAADDQHFIDAITRGYGAMYGFADRLEPRDRWAVVAYLRALQLSRHAALADLPAEERAALEHLR
jgi:mono/diheme cytochrome c family protein